MQRAMVVTVASLVVVALASGCMQSRQSRRAEATRAAERAAAQDVDVEINVERQERRVGVADADRERRGERARAAPGEVAAAMIAPGECPMLEGAQVALVDLGDGAALEFLAGDADDVQIVRDRVLNIAVKHQRAMQGRLGETSPHEARGDHDPSRAQRRQARMEANIDPMPPSHVAVVDVDRGARIIFVPVDRRDLDRLNDTLEDRAAYMREGSCPANLMSMQVPDEPVR